jgi:hypothetical protein
VLQLSPLLVRGFFFALSLLTWKLTTFAVHRDMLSSKRATSEPDENTKGRLSKQMVWMPLLAATKLTFGRGAPLGRT